MKVRNLVFSIAGVAMIAAPIIHGLVVGDFGESPEPSQEAVLQLDPPSLAEQTQVESLPSLASPAGETDSSPLAVNVAFDHGVLAPGDSDATMMIDLSPQVGAQTVRNPISIALLIDTSGSMEGRKLANARSAAMRFINQLEPQDRVTLISFSRQEMVRLDRHELSSGIEPVRQAVNRMFADGSTCISCALIRAYGLLAREGSSRHCGVIVLSDGEANRGTTDPFRLENMARRAQDDFGITTSTVGLGAEFNEDILSNISSGGNGEFAFVHNSSEIQNVLDQRLHGMTQVVARNVRIELIPAHGVTLNETDLQRARRRGEQVSIDLGHLASSDQRRFLLPMTLPPGQLSDVAQIRVTYKDQQGETQTFRSTARLARSADQSVVRASYNRDVDVEVTRRRSARQVESTLANCSRGDQSVCLANLDREVAHLEQRAQEIQAPELAQEASQLRAMSGQIRRSKRRARRRMARGAYLVGKARAQEFRGGVANPYHRPNMYRLNAME